MATYNGEERLSHYSHSANPNIATVFIAWLNLDLGIDVCPYTGMDAYIKQRLQVVFPAYVIILVAFISERSSRFARLIGRGNPVATLATLLLLSYAKLLRVIIDIFSFAFLKYPDGSTKMVFHTSKVSTSLYFWLQSSFSC